MHDRRYLVVCGLSMFGCVGEMPPAESSTEQATFVCGVGPTVKGIDVSKYEPTINWQDVAADGVEFAFVRVSDGTMFPDELFDSHWAGSRAAGIKHGAYQFFRPSEDPIVQADMLLAKIGNTLAADDLPPVIDLEASDDQPAATIASKLQAWIDRVTASIGRSPIVYTNRPFWRDSIGDLDFSAYPLWHAQYTSAPCPNIATPWPTWHIWQFTETGTVNGIMHDVDVNRWNGTRASLDAFLGPKGSSASTCGDGACTVGEDASSCPQDCPRCGTVGARGGVIDDGDACFEQGGPVEFMRHVTTTGQDGDLVWTKASNRPDTVGAVNYGMWHLFIEEPGRYQVDVFTEADFARSKQAKYVVQAGGSSVQVAIDQTAVDGWQALGAFDFVEGGYQSVFLGDNTGELPADNVQIVFDAVRLTRVSDGAATDDGNSNGDGDSPASGGCAVGGNQLGLVLLGLLAGLRRRRRARDRGRIKTRPVRARRDTASSVYR
jgi:GH25 family lysozyme M1 (1,4-beta-N-acetylmuramidase)